MTLKARAIVAGSDDHLTLLGAPMHFNLLTGQDRADMLAHGRLVWAAATKHALSQVADGIEQATDRLGARDHPSA